MTAQPEKPTPCCIHTALLDRTSMDGQRDIILDENHCINAEELAQRITTVASHLVARQATGRAVGILTGNTIEAVVAYFACLKAGAVVAALPRNAPGVVSRIIGDGHISMLLTDPENSLAVQPKVPVISINTLKQAAKASDAPASDPHQPAHLLFTSGTTTGKPRSVLTDHIGSMLSHEWRTSLWPYEPHDVVGCNIFGMWDVVPALHAGIPVVLLADQTIRDPLSLGAAVTRYGITRMMLTPTLLDACLRCQQAVTALSRLRLLVLCGEAISPSLHKRMIEMLPCVRIVNLYSLSECHDVAAGELPPQGEAIRLTLAPFVKVYISDEQACDRVLAEGTTGRILVGGPGLARQIPAGKTGHHGFFKLHISELKKVDVFDTGDRGVIMPNGSLEVLGRCGASVKIRGTWVAPLDLEAMLQKCPGIAQACVTTSENTMGHLSLLAHVVPEADKVQFDVDAAFQWLREHLHPAAVPSRIIPRQALPLLATGKVDRKQLSQPFIESTKEHHSRHDQSMTEKVREAFQKTLGRTDITSNDPFNNMGGDSLAAVSLCVDLEHRTGRRIAPSDLKPTDTPATLAARLISLAPGKQNTVPPLAPTLSPLPGALKKLARPPATILVTGATGGLGQSLVKLLSATSGMRVLAMTRSGSHSFPNGIRTVTGDLTLPRFGWSDATFDAVAMDIDTVVHLAADMNMLAPYTDLQNVNVAGTETVIQLAARAGASLTMASSSAVFPLHFGSHWPESFHGSSRLGEQRTSLITSGADGYSLTKHDAELLAWQAREKGLPVHVIRIPHLLTPSQPSRLSYVAKAWAASGLMPEGPWHWQFAPPEAVAEALLSIVMRHQPEREPVTHLALTPLPAQVVQAIIESLGYAARMTTMPATAMALCREGTLAPLVMRYGPAAAMCVNEPLLETPVITDIDSTDYLRRCLQEALTA